MHCPAQRTSCITDIWPASARDPLEFPHKCLSFPQGCDVEVLILRLLKDRSLPRRRTSHPLFITEVHDVVPLMQLVAITCSKHLELTELQLLPHLLKYMTT